MAAADLAETVEGVSDRYVAAYAALDPVSATRLGLVGHDAGMTDYGPEAVEARAELAREARRRVLAVEAHHDGERLAADVLAERLAAIVDVHDSGEWLRDLNILSCPVQHVRESFDLLATETVEDWEVVAGRMAGVPGALAGYRDTLSEGAARGMVAARRQALACAVQARAWSEGVDGFGPFFPSLVDRFRAAGRPDASLEHRLDRAATAATAAYAELADYLGGAYAAAAAEHDGVGPDRYALLNRAWNGVELDLVETYEWGWDELRRIDDEMTRAADEILPGEPRAAVVRLLDTDPSRAIEGEEQLRAWLQALMDEAMAGLEGVHFDIPPPVRRLEAMIAPAGGAAAQYYTGPSEDFRRPGRTWYPTQGRTRFPLWGEVSTAYHEGVPGHHLQVAMTQYRRDRLNRFQRTMAFTAGHSEGWALYAERLMGELGYLDKPDYRLGMLSGQAMRAIRVVTDIGLHLDLSVPAGERFHPGERWTPALAAELLSSCSSQPASYVASEVDRYLGMPGQAISYKVGERVWLAGREAARKRSGPDFDLKAFHARALDLGPMGLAELERRLPDC